MVVKDIIKPADFVITKNTAKDEDYFCEIKKAGAVIKTTSAFL